MKRIYGLIAASALLGAAAWAVAPGGTLYIKNKGVKLLKDPKAGSKELGGELKIGKEVVWNGASKADKAFHEIKVDGKPGFVLMSNLTPNKPQDEIKDSSGAPMSAQAFASSGAATKALTPAAIKYAESKKEDGVAKPEESAAQIIYIEEHNKNKGTLEAVAAKSKELGGAK